MMISLGKIKEQIKEMKTDGCITKAFYGYVSFDDVQYLITEVDRLNTENEKLRECVEFYASTESWTQEFCTSAVFPEIDRVDISREDGCRYGGKLAREILKEIWGQ